MASAPPKSPAEPQQPTPAVLLTLGMFLFGMGTMAYSDLQRRTGWRHAATERFMDRADSLHRR